MKDYREVERFKCKYGRFTKIKQTTNAIAWKVEEPGGSTAFEVWSFPNGWCVAPRPEDYGKTGYYTRSEKEVDFWIGYIEKRHSLTP